MYHGSKFGEFGVWCSICAVLLSAFQVQSPSGEDDEVFAGNVSLDEGILDADDDVKVGGHGPSKVSGPKVILVFIVCLR